jgi:preprotein translocase subunit YajC
MGGGQGLGLLFKIGLGLVALFKFFKTPADAMTKLHLLLAQAPAPAPSGASALMQLAPLVLMFAAMYFLLIAPQRKKQKEHEKMLAALVAGDEVVTAGGIYGVITGVKDDRYIIRIGDNNAKVEVGKSFVSALVKKASAA